MWINNTVTVLGHKVICVKTSFCCILYSFVTVASALSSSLSPFHTDRQTDRQTDKHTLQVKVTHNTHYVNLKFEINIQELKEKYNFFCRFLNVHLNFITKHAQWKQDTDIHSDFSSSLPHVFIAIHSHVELILGFVCHSCRLKQSEAFFS
jgi:hypothetical protein